MKLTPEKYEEMDLEESAYRPPESGWMKVVIVFFITIGIAALAYVIYKNPL